MLYSSSGQLENYSNKVATVQSKDYAGISMCHHQDSKEHVPSPLPSCPPFQTPQTTSFHAGQVLLPYLVPRLPDLFNIHEKEGEPGIQSRVANVIPYTKVGRWRGVIIECGRAMFSSTPVQRGWKIRCQSLQVSVIGPLQTSKSCFWC